MSTSWYVLISRATQGGVNWRLKKDKRWDFQLFLFDIRLTVRKRVNGQDKVQNASTLDKKLLSLDYAWICKLCKTSTYWLVNKIHLNWKTKQRKDKDDWRKLFGSRAEGKTKGNPIRTYKFEIQKGLACGDFSGRLENLVVTS